MSAHVIPMDDLLTAAWRENEAMAVAHPDQRVARRDALTAGAILIAGLAAIAVGITGDVAVLGAASPWWHAIPLIVGVLAIAAQRRWPRVALAVGVACLGVDGLSGWSLGTALVAWEVLYTASLRFPWTWVNRLRRGAIILALGITVAVAIVTQDVRTVANVGVVVFAVLGTPIWWGVDVRRQADIATMVEERADHERDEAVRAERGRMARDLHDAVAGDLSSISLHAEAALRQTAPEDATYESLATIRRSGVRAMGELSTMISLLRRDAADDVVSAPGLDELGSLVDHAQASGLRVRVSRHGETPLPLAVDHAAYRIVQESLTNAVRHGGPGEVDLRYVAGRDLEVEVLSPTTRADATRGSGLGLVTMRERAEGLGGSFECGEHHGRWRVYARMPLQS
ncbi:sensor histidine kinase [Demetria terragena]|uniref:sensor histidine kinase n=1 Tax=Demetria terragena TaxID=63959 RepID=UPI0003A4269A|nr:histidine kinase [Demetria terragena]